MSQCQRRYYPLEVEKCLTYCDTKVTGALFRFVHDTVTYTISKTNPFENVL